MYSTQNKIVTIDQLTAKLNIWRLLENKIVFTNGCFDILHAGHVLYLEEARQLGDKLIVGLNSDASVKRLKGAERPVITQTDRAILLAALEYVDGVIVFEEDTPYELIEQIAPDVLVKGGDYEIEEIVGHEIVLENGGQVHSLKHVKGKSTSEIVDKIRRS